MRIIFAGTPAFAVPSLKILTDHGYEVVAVITAPDKPAGRGQKTHQSEVKQFAVANNIPVLQPQRLKDALFLEDVKALRPDLQIVVAFRMMPAELWRMPPLGTFNLHASLLPQYRGAAPVQRAIMNGEKITGVTTFFLKHEIDTGNIIYREEVPIGDHETGGELHDKLMVAGSRLVLKTVQAIEKGMVTPRDQSEFIQPGEVLKHAPKIFRQDCKLNFSEPVKILFDKVRALSPHPGAFFEYIYEGTTVPVKVLAADMEELPVVLSHHLLTDNRTYIKISAKDGMLNIRELQWPNKKRMKTGELLRGMQLAGSAHIG